MRELLERILPLGASTHAADLDGVLASVHLHMAIQAVAWGTFLAICLVRFRQRARERSTSRDLPPLFPLLAIGVVIAGDAVLLATSALPAWRTRTTPPAAIATALDVRVTAEQFAWNIHYPGPDGRFGRTAAALISASNPVGIDRASEDAADDVGLLNILTVPVNRLIVVHLSSRDVVHSFTLNEMRVRQDATPGQIMRTWFTPTMTCRWEIGCSQLCGLGHYRMRGSFSVVTPEEWTAWLAREVALIDQTLR